MIDTTPLMAMPVIVGLLIAGVMLGLVLGIIAARSRSTHATCGRCRYDLSGSIGAVDRCPECGALFTEAGIMPPGRNLWPRLMVSSWLLVFGSAAAAVAIFFGSQDTVQTVQVAPAPLTIRIIPAPNTSGMRENNQMMLIPNWEESRPGDEDLGGAIIIEPQLPAHPDSED